MVIFEGRRRRRPFAPPEQPAPSDALHPSKLNPSSVSNRVPDRDEPHLKKRRNERLTDRPIPDLSVPTKSLKSRSSTPTHDPGKPLRILPDPAAPVLELIRERTPHAPAPIGS